jgi:UDP-N-acetylglucosamine 2-epimerase (non-hydrolysing)
MKIVMAFGTRPDQIKLAPLAKELQDKCELLIWYGGQGWDLRPAEYQYIVSHEAKIDWNHGLDRAISEAIAQFGDYLFTNKPDCAIVHGDDATAFACALAAFLNRVPIVHIEAGLRTYAHNPYPEEGFRRQIATMAELHLAPSEVESRNLEVEQVNGQIFVTGNTINDTIDVDYPPKILATLHRRENWGKPIHEALKVLDNNTDKFDITVITHPNWVNHTHSINMPASLTYIDPTNREDLLHMVDHVDLVVTDSGGLQEECALMGVPCIVYRDFTERAGLEYYGSVHMVDPNTPWDLEDALLYYWNSRFVYGIPGTVSKLMSSHIIKWGQPTQN